VAKRLNLTTTTLYTYVNGDGTPKSAGQAVLDGTHRPGAAATTRSRRPHVGGGLDPRIDGDVGQSGQ
jgi:hypothetical protein